MQAAATYLGLVPQIVQRLAGPVFDKELRVASRQRRYYLLRLAYVSLLMTVVVCVWSSVVHFGGLGSPVVRASRLAEAGKRIVVTIVWFQFMAGQVLAVALLSDAISSEARRRTLDAVLVAPMGSLYIVVGKLTSRLFQILLLLSISLPLLAVIRVLGGVSWSYVLSGLCITLTAAVFAGSLNLLASMTDRHAYRAIVLVGLWYLVAWGVLSGMLGYLSQTGYVNQAVAASVLFLANPFTTLSAMTEVMLGKLGRITAPPYWLLHCLVMLLAAAGVLALAVRRVRGITYASISARAGESLRRVYTWWTSGRTQAEEAIRRVKGPPAIWKELLGFSLRSRRQGWFAVGLSIAFVFLVIVLSAFFRSPVYVVLFCMTLALQLAFVVCLVMSAAGAITREKEACTWPILLTAPLSNKRIVEDKATGAVRRNLPLLVRLSALYLSMLPFCPNSTDPGVPIVFPMINLAGTIVFVLGVGLYVSMRLRTTAAAVVWTLSLYYVPKFLFWSAVGPPFFVAGMRTEEKIAAAFVLSVLPACLYFGAGALCMRAATRRLRYNVFEEDSRWSLHRSK